MKKQPAFESLILTIRNQKVLLDADLAAIYGVPTKALYQAVKRNADRFPPDFIFCLTAGEFADLRSQIVTANAQPSADQYYGALRSQFATASRGGRRNLPHAFTEHGAIMAATVLNSPEAVKMSVFVVRAFVQMREQLAANAAILKRLAEIDKTLLEHDQALGVIWQQIQPLLAPQPAPPKPRIRFHRDEKP